MKKGMMTIVMFLTLYTFGEVSSNFTFSSNYFWRGMTQTMDSPAYSGGFDYSHESGFYAGTWGSNVSFGGAGLELDLYAGYAGETESGIGYDFGYINYAYPEVDDADFSEMYGSLSYEGFGLHITWVMNLVTTMSFLMVLDLFLSHTVIMKTLAQTI
ncbi:MAG: hypothetical protein CM15mP19_07450 [Gammaproteobacteria bacterium]|nr:MAG: hypothetical protein CM15mP19_07450 [Gammaproteobacteria bacterium]